MPLFVNCPHCRHRLTVSDQNIGQNVQCPRCSGSFHLSIQASNLTAASANSPSSAEPLPPPVQMLAKTEDNAAIRLKVFRPAIGLLVTGALTTLVGLLFLPALLFPELVGEEVTWDPVELVLSVLFMVITLTLGIVTLFGAIKMLTLQSYPLAMCSAIAAMVPCYCFLLGLPMGIWALIVLRGSEVKSAFKQQ